MRVITFSRVFPSYHPRAGEQTRFIEKIYAGLADILPGFKIPNDANAYWDWHEYYNCRDPKFHTIRAGHRWKVGDWFKPVVWGDDINPKSGRRGPYHSKQIQFAPDIQIKKVWNFDIAGYDGKLFIDGSPFTSRGMLLFELANNDGLTGEDFKAWFKHPKPFEGQIICWSDSINY